MRTRRSTVLATLLTFGIVAPAQAAITKGPWVQHVTETSAVVRVEVDPPSAVALDVGPEADAGVRTSTSSPRSLHSIAVDQLQPGTRYALSVRSGGTTKTGS